MEYCKGQTLYHRLRGEKSPNGKVYYGKKISDGEVARSVCSYVSNPLSYVVKR